MNKIISIIYGLLWIIYGLFSYYLFPLFNVNVGIITMVLVVAGAWFFGTTKGLLVIVVTIPYNYFLLDHYASILDPYQAKAFGTSAQTLLVLLTASLKRLRDQTHSMTIALDEKVASRTEELNLLIERLITDDENNRRTLGQDIHDGLGQYLTGLALYGNKLLSAMENDCPSEQKKILTDIINSVHRNLLLARKISRTLFPFTVSEYGLRESFDELTSYFSETKNIDFKVSMDGSEREFCDEVILQSYRITYEFILNTLHHTNPSHIAISLFKNRNNHTLCISIENCDNLDTIRNDMFIELMRYRSKLIHAQLNISIPTETTRSILLDCTLPHTMTNGATSKEGSRTDA